MKIGRMIAGTGAMLGLLCATGAMAAETRSGAALPSVQSAATAPAPVQGVRHAKSRQGLSMQSDESMSTGGYVAAGLAAAIVIAGVVVAASDDNNRPDSSG